ncbi:MAG: BBP7 family outer membrane beta-barrel protein [Planctomycetia bacterium]|nr:BBP7 family outer membrane beta-barrel protein [Planctomycetia bacterium]
MMNKKRISRLLLTAIFFAVSGVTHGNIRDAQLFESSIPNNYDGGVRANDGFFFTFNFLYWQLPSPDDGVVGDPAMDGNPVYWNTLATEPSEGTQSSIRSDWNSGSFEDVWKVGQKYTFGFMNEHWGWNCQIFTIGGSSHVNGRNVQVGFNDPGEFLHGYYGRWETTDEEEVLVPVRTEGTERLGVNFPVANMYNKIETWGIEFNMIRRSHATSVGIFELGVGVRYLKWDETFGFNGGAEVEITEDEDGNETITYINRGVLDGSSWNTSSVNHLVGPQLALRWFRTTGRFSLDVTGKFIAAYNAQEIRQGGYLSNGVEFYEENFYHTQIPAGGMSVTSRKETYDVFSPAVELNVNMNFTITRKMAFQVGWTGLFMMDVARPMGMTDYTLSDDYIFGLKSGKNKEDIFVHGFNAGILFNY